MEPIVSVPIARGLNPAATATVEPVDEPPGDCGERIISRRLPRFGKPVLTHRVAEYGLAFADGAHVRRQRLTRHRRTPGGCHHLHTAELLCDMVSNEGLPTPPPLPSKFGHITVILVFPKMIKPASISFCTMPELFVALAPRKA